MNDTIIVVADTLYRAIPLDSTILLVQQKEPIFSWHISLGDVLTIFGMAFSFGAFIYQMHKTRIENKQHLRSKWYLEVIVEPNMGMINKFYQDIITECDQAVSDLFSYFQSNMGTKEFKTHVALTKRKIKDEITTSLDHFTILLKASEPQVATKINNQLDSLVDTVTEAIDEYENFKDKPSSKSQILDNKQKFVAILYEMWNC